MRVYSLPFVVFGVIFLFLLILQLDVLVNSFIGLALAAICLYPFVLLYSYLRFYKIKTTISNKSGIHEKVMMDEIGREYLLGWEVLGEGIILNVFLTIQLLYNALILRKMYRL